MTGTATEEETPIRPVPRGRGGRAVAWFLVACWLLYAAARLAGADRTSFLAPVLIPAMAGLPYAAAGVIVPVAAAALARSRAAFAASLALVALFAAIVLPRALPGGRPGASGPELRVLTANLRFGGAGDATLVDLVRRVRADVLSVQELTPDAVRRLDESGLARLLPYRMLDPREGPAGSGLYARYPLTPLPAHRRTGFAMPSATLAVPDAPPVRLTAAHPVAPLGRDITTWAHDLAALPRATPEGQVGIVAGDFNATLDHARLRDLMPGYVDAADATGQGLVTTFRPWPPITIDHVLADRRCAVLRVKVYLQPNSDHRALFADLRLP